MSTDVTPQEASRISTHMNNEHGESLGNYLELYGKIKNAVDPKITSFTTPSMTLEYGPPGKREHYIYKFDPPMLAGQARKRLEEMHSEARKELGLSNVRINEFTLSGSAWVALVVLTVVELGILVCPPAIFAAWTPWGVKQVAKLFPYLDIAPTPTNLGRGLQAALTLFLALPHLYEVEHDLKPLLRKYNVTSASARTAYISATLIAGLFVWTDLKKTGLKQERALAEKDKTH